MLQLLTDHQRCSEHSQRFSFPPNAQAAQIDVALERAETHGPHVMHNGFLFDMYAITSSGVAVGVTDGQVATDGNKDGNKDAREGAQRSGAGPITVLALLPSAHSPHA